MAGDGERPRFAGFDFAGMAAEFLGVRDVSDPVLMAMQYAAGAATPPEMPAARRLLIARTMQEFFREMERKVAAEMGNGGQG